MDIHGYKGNLWYIMKIFQVFYNIVNALEVSKSKFEFDLM
jgi:hypothetical protein